MAFRIDPHLRTLIPSKLIVTDILGSHRTPVPALDAHCFKFDSVTRIKDRFTPAGLFIPKPQLDFLCLVVYLASGRQLIDFQPLIFVN